MSVPAALAALKTVRDLLEREVSRAREARSLLGGLDGAALLEAAGARARFNADAAEAELAVASALREVARAAGRETLDLPALRTLAPELSPAFESLLDDVRARAAALAHEDGLNRRLAERSMRVVSGYLAAVTPRAASYDRKGLRAPAALSSLTTRA